MGRSNELDILQFWIRWTEEPRNLVVVEDSTCKITPIPWPERARAFATEWHKYLTEMETYEKYK